jgi:hypothetical protein
MGGGFCGFFFSCTLTFSTFSFGSKSCLVDGGLAPMGGALARAFGVLASGAPLRLEEACGAGGAAAVCCSASL